MSSIKFGDYTPPKKVIIPGKSAVTIGIFFDGTLNNIYNTLAKENNTDAFKKYGGAKKTSYYNDKSNVARLWEFYNSDERIYIEGAGTIDPESELSKSKGRSDHKLGYMFGNGPTGIRAKVKSGHKKIIEKTRLIIQKEKNIDSVSELTLDVFGFSRGAAEARNFIAEITHKAYPAIKASRNRNIYKNMFNEQVYTAEIPEHGHFGELLAVEIFTIDKITIRFAGLYDTVSSYHPTMSLSPDFRNDVTQLKLNNLSTVKNIVHFIAMDEHRINFPITHIRGFERQFPGVHSDIGGSYHDGEEIVDEIETSKLKNGDLIHLKKKLEEQGWYKEGELVFDTSPSFYHKLTGKRNLSKKYSFILLHFMADFAIKNNAKINLTKLVKKNIL